MTSMTICNYSDAELAYFEYFLEHVKMDEHGCYRQLLWLLYNERFHPVNKGDEFLTDDIVFIRMKWAEKQLAYTICHDWAHTKDVSVLELYDVLVWNIYQKVLDENEAKGHLPHITFWELMGRSGFTEYDDGNYREEEIHKRAQEIATMKYDDDHTPFGRIRRSILYCPPHMFANEPLIWQARAYLFNEEYYNIR